jgi:alpha-N-arabinofuranosidase
VITGRRSFIGHTAAGIACALVARSIPGVRAQSGDSRLEILVNEPIGAGAADMPPNYLWAYPGSLRDALVAALTLDIFNRHADKIVMANVAQLINTIHSLFIAHEDKFAVTPNYHVFAMYQAHQGAQSLKTVFSSPSIAYAREGQARALWGLAGSASLRDKTLTVTVVNPHATETRECTIDIRGATVKDGRATVLSSTDLRAHNSFTHPDALAPRDASFTRRAGSSCTRSRRRR